VDSRTVAQGPFRLLVEPFLPLLGDTCDHPAPLQLGVSQSWSFAQAFDDLATGCPGMGKGLDVIFQFAPPLPGPFKAHLVPESGLSLQAYTTPVCGAGCTWMSYPAGAEEILYFTADDPVFIVVEALQRGTFSIVVEEAPSPPPIP
jgi:hypothetical protein